MNGDKKKMLVLGVLALLLIAVGAFSFLGGGSGGGEVAAKLDSTDKTTVAEGEGAEGKDGSATPDKATGMYGEPKDDLLAAMPYEVRDPFSIPVAFNDKPVEPPKPTTQPEQHAPVATGGSNEGYRPVNPGGIGGTLPPIGNIGGGQAAPMVATPMYTVKGIILGSKPMAVFEDGDGNQKLVPMGGSVDGDTKVVGIEAGKVTVSRNGKRHTLVIDEVARND